MDNCNKLWTKKEEEVLIDLYTSKNLKIYEICNILKRTSGAIHARLEKMDLKRNISLKLENDIEYILDELKKIHLILDKIHNNKIYTEI